MVHYPRPTWGRRDAASQAGSSSPRCRPWRLSQESRLGTFRGQIYKLLTGLCRPQPTFAVVRGSPPPGQLWVLSRTLRAALGTEASVFPQVQRQRPEGCPRPGASCSPGDTCAGSACGGRGLRGARRRERPPESWPRSRPPRLGQNCVSWYLSRGYRGGAAGWLDLLFPRTGTLPSLFTSQAVRGEAQAGAPAGCSSSRASPCCRLGPSPRSSLRPLLHLDA